MERHEVLEMMTQLKLAGMRAVYDDILAGRAQAPSSGATDHRHAAPGRDRRQEGTFDQVPDGVRQAADGQGAGRLRLRRLARQPAPDPGARHRQLPRRPAQHRPRRRHRHRQDPSRCRRRALLHQKGAHAAGATTSSTWSTTSRPSFVPGARGVPQSSSSAVTSSSSTSSATCPSLRPAGSSSSTS